MDTPFEFSINDTRLTKDFKGITISGYKRTDVTNVFFNSLFNCELENACRWSIELHSTGLIKNIFDKIELLYFKNVNINNPYFFFYYYKKKDYLYKLLKQYPKNNIIFSRNCQEIRNLITELVCIICLTKKNILFENKSLPKIKKDFNEPGSIRSKIIAKNTTKIYKYLIGNDPSEVRLALNEIVNILHSFDCNFNKVVYWYLWLKKITSLKLKGKNKTDFSFKCHDFEVSGVGDMYKCEWVWGLWKIILDNATKGDKLVNKFIKKIYIEFKKGYNGYSNKNKHYQIILALYLLTTSINWKINVRQQDSALIQAVANINYLYKQVEINLTQHLDIEQIKKRFNYTYGLFDTLMKKEKKRMEDIVLIQDTRTGSIIEQKVNMKEIRQKQIEEKSRKKCEAFMNIVPKRKMDSINESELQRKNVQEYFDGFNERIIEISDVKPQRQKYGETKLSKLDLVF